METKFKVGDRVNDHHYGDGTVMHCDGRMHVVAFDEEYPSLNECNGYAPKGNGLWIDMSHLSLIATDTAPPTHPDRADYAFGFAKTMLEKVAELNQSDLDLIPIDAVKLADALIAELQKTKQ
jgi:hypothetical protein